MTAVGESWGRYPRARHRIVHEFLIALGVFVFWLYYQMTIHGIAALLPAEWRNSPLG